MLLYINSPWSIGKGLRPFKKLAFFTFISNYIRWIDIFMQVRFNWFETNAVRHLAKSKNPKICLLNKKIISKHHFWKCNCISLEIVFPFKRETFWPKVIPFNFQVSIRREYIYPRWSTYIPGNNYWGSTCLLDQKYWGISYSLLHWLAYDLELLVL